MTYIREAVRARDDGGQPGDRVEKTVGPKGLFIVGGTVKEVITTA